MASKQSQHDPRLWRGNAAVFLGVTTLLLVFGALYLPQTQPPRSNAVVAGLFGCGLLQLAWLVIWYNQHRISGFAKLFHEPVIADSPIETRSSGVGIPRVKCQARSDEKPREDDPFKNSCWREMSSEFRDRTIAGLASALQENRQFSVHVLSSMADSPIPRIDCWPVRTCSLLQFAAAEAILREWIEYLDTASNLSENQLIHLMFPVEYERERDRPRVRTFRMQPPDPPRPPPPAPPAPSAWDHVLDRWNDAVRDAIIDRPGDGEENEFSVPEEDQPLAVLDRERFTANLHEKFNEVAGHIADTVSTPRTDFELAKTENEVGRFLPEFRWDAPALALDLRVPDGVPNAPALPTHNPPGMHPHRADAWARKYRRMCDHWGRESRRRRIMKLPQVMGLVFCERLNPLTFSLERLFQGRRFRTFPTPPQHFEVYVVAL